METRKRQRHADERIIIIYINYVVEGFDYRAAVGIVPDSGQETDVVSEPAQSVRNVSTDPAADTFHLTRQHPTVQLEHDSA